VWPAVDPGSTLGQMLREGGHGAGDEVRLPPDTITLTTAVSLMAGAVHAVASVEHLLGVFFLAAAVFQIAWGVAVYRGTSPQWLRAGAIVNGVIIGVWILSRTVGLPVGPEPWTPETVGILGVMAVLDEALIVVLATRVLPVRRRDRRLVALAVPAAATLTVLSLTATVLGSHH